MTSLPRSTSGVALHPLTQAIERILGFAPAEVIGRSLRRHVPQERLHTHAEMLNRKLQRGSKHALRGRGAHKSRRATGT